MVRYTLKQISKFSSLAMVVAILLAPAFIINKTYATASCVTQNGVKTCTCDGTPCDADSTFKVSVSELLTVSLTEPDSWATGSINTLLTNKVVLSVSSNNNAGYQATMTSANTSAGTNLVNSTNSDYIIPTIDSNTFVSSNAAAMLNHWGYNIVNNGATAPTTFAKMVAANTTPIRILSSTTPSQTTKDIYFGAKASGDKASGTYSNTVVISVVSGVNADTQPTPATPANPTTPTSDSNNNGGTVAYNNGYTVYTNENGKNTYSEISSGDNTSAYSGYTYPQGETNTVASIGEGTPLATGLAVTAAVAATSGIVFFIIAKRRNDEEDEDEEDY